MHVCVSPCMSVCEWQAGWGLCFARRPGECRWKQSWSVKADEMCLSAPRELASWFLFDRLKPWHQPPPPTHTTTPALPSTTALVVHTSAIYSLASCKIFYTACVTPFIPINWTDRTLSMSVFPIKHTSLCRHFPCMHTHTHTRTR